MENMKDHHGTRISSTYISHPTLWTPNCDTIYPSLASSLWGTEVWVRTRPRSELAWRRRSASNSGGLCRCGWSREQQKNTGVVLRLRHTWVEILALSVTLLVTLGGHFLTLLKLGGVREAGTTRWVSRAWWIQTPRTTFSSLSFLLLSERCAWGHRSYSTRRAWLLTLFSIPRGGGGVHLSRCCTCCSASFRLPSWFPSQGTVQILRLLGKVCTE